MMDRQAFETLVDARDRIVQQGPEYLKLAHSLHEIACAKMGGSSSQPMPRLIVNNPVTELEALLDQLFYGTTHNQTILRDDWLRQRRESREENERRLGDLGMSPGV